MKIKCLFAFINLSFATVCHAQGTAFTYQGKLNDGANPANGIYDFQFTLYATNTTGDVIAGPETNNVVAVSNGLFSVIIDFGSAVFGNGSCWLEVGVCTNAGDRFTTLMPRQLITPAPYAISALGLTGVIANNFVNTAGFSTVGGGRGNDASGTMSTVGGGHYNFASGYGAVIAGGGDDGTNSFGNSASGNIAFIGSGLNNVAGGYGSFIGGGLNNGVIGEGSVVTGGNNNHAGVNVYGLHHWFLYQTDYSFVGGGHNNLAYGYGAVVGGGGDDGVASFGNQALGNASFIGGGLGNNANGNYSVVCGGSNNFAGGYSCVGGGVNNMAGDYSAVCNGSNNFAGGYSSSIAGGVNNFAVGDYSAIAGGSDNQTMGKYSFAAGNNAQANNDGVFVWSDGTGTPTASTTNNQFVARASGGIVFYTSTNSDGISLAAGSGSWSSMSDRNSKEKFTVIDRQSILARVASLPLTAWSYKTEPGVRHLGPMAQDFYSAFGVGPDDRHITTVDESGVALAAIQGLNQKIEQKDEEIAELKTRLEKIERFLKQTNGLRN